MGAIFSRLNDPGQTVALEQTSDFPSARPEEAILSDVGVMSIEPFLLISLKKADGDFVDATTNNVHLLRPP